MFWLPFSAGQSGSPIQSASHCFLLSNAPSATLVDPDSEFMITVVLWEIVSEPGALPEGGGPAAGEPEEDSDRLVLLRLALVANRYYRLRQLGPFFQRWGLLLATPGFIASALLGERDLARAPAARRSMQDTKPAADAAGLGAAGDGSPAGAASDASVEEWDDEGEGAEAGPEGQEQVGTAADPLPAAAPAERRQRSRAAAKALQPEQRWWWPYTFGEVVQLSWAELFCEGGGLDIWAALIAAGERSLLAGLVCWMDCCVPSVLRSWVEPCSATNAACFLARAVFLGICLALLTWYEGWHAEW